MMICCFPVNTGLCFLRSTSFGRVFNEAPPSVFLGCDTSLGLDDRSLAHSHRVCVSKAVISSAGHGHSALTNVLPTAQEGLEPSTPLRNEREPYPTGTPMTHSFLNKGIIKYINLTI